ncbi:MAG: hypothetical protein ACOYOK_15995 [Pseudobdellovibrionaceae bacterium]
MLTKKDLVLIGEVVENIINVRVPEIVERIVEPKFEEFAILMQNEFRAIHETKADKTDIDRLMEIIETKADKTDITILENKFEGRIERLEDNMRIVKTTLKLT